jgi:hypothetical protein
VAVEPRRGVHDDAGGQVETVRHQCGVLRVAGTKRPVETSLSTIISTWMTVSEGQAVQQHDVVPVGARTALQPRRLMPGHCRSLTREAAEIPWTFRFLWVLFD